MSLGAGAHPHVLVIGASGYLGRAVTERLVETGHDVVALTRERAETTPVHHGDTVRGDLREPDSLRAAVTPDVDAVIHLATPLGNEAADLAALEAIITQLSGSGRPFLYTSGVWVLGPSPAGAEPFDEDAPPRPLALVGYRHRLEERVLAAADEGVRGMVIRPGVAHGRAGGIPALLLDLAQQHREALHVGEERVRWPMVHVDDLAELFVLALRDGAARSIFHGVSEGVDTRDLAASVAVAAGVSGTRPWSLTEAAAALGQSFAEALATDQVVSAVRTRHALGWQPRHPNALEDLAHGSYRRLQVG
ncbi:NAD-dependent epimerase/dehydratase family protein [Humibacillus xanthopallidus]|uniref:Nucleoside-diphosphate-sugar epimerase n=1 Tax=Humibacillus xanthopallidus TaxID=412689 RepID=A0A543HI29_9MICO|nr:NAD-dependent epimerase/dehydratase family protein [Humibacillus xanthopallidus]TQM57947.1 nucleoside-diphosphate-sugar epimerase [Humibacillus xanthopallidus]